MCSDSAKSVWRLLSSTTVPKVLLTSLSVVCETIEYDILKLRILREANPVSFGIWGGLKPLEHSYISLMTTMLSRQDIMQPSNERSKSTLMLV